MPFGERFPGGTERASHRAETSSGTAGCVESKIRVGAVFSRFEVAKRRASPVLSLVALAGLIGASACTVLTAPNDEGPAGPDSSATEGSYTLLHLPTPDDGFGIARSINGHGEIVGWAHDADETPRALLWRDGHTEMLPALGGTSSGAEDINEAGWIVGHAENAQGEPRAVLWVEGQARDLGTLGGAMSFARAVNDRGQVVGSAETAEGQLHAFLWEDGHMTDLGALPGAEASSAHGINEAGLIVGSSLGGEHLQRATLWDGGRVVDLGTLGNESGASAIDDSGRIVGGSIPHHQTSALAVLWEGEELRELGTLGGEFSSASGLNNRGRVVGASESAECEQCAFVWHDDRMRGLPTEADALAGAQDISESGAVVGFAGGPAIWTTDSSSVWARIGAGPPAPGPYRAPPAARADAPGGAPARPAWAETVCRAHGPIGDRLSALEVAAGC